MQFPAIFPPASQTSSACVSDELQLFMKSISCSMVCVSHSSGVLSKKSVSPVDFFMYSIRALASFSFALRKMAVLPSFNLNSISFIVILFSTNFLLFLCFICDKLSAINGSCSLDRARRKFPSVYFFCAFTRMKPCIHFMPFSIAAIKSLL